MEDAQDRLALTTAEEREARLGKAAARANHLPVDLVTRLMAGEHPARIWRERRGLSVQALADASGVARSYLMEIEAGKKPGSVAAYRRLAAALEVSVDELLPPEAEGSKTRTP